MHAHTVVCSCDPSVAYSAVLVEHQCQWLGTDCPPRVIDFSSLGDGIMTNPLQ